MSLTTSIAAGAGSTHALHVFDPAALVRLAHDVHDAAFVSRLVDRFQALLPQRLERILTALCHDDLAMAMDATLSLKVASSTVGTRELSTLARSLEDDVRRGDTDAARDRAAGLPVAAERASTALADYLDGGGVPSPGVVVPFARAGA